MFMIPIEKKTSEEYKRRLDDALRVAGNGDWYWNERFRSALQARGLTLSVGFATEDRKAYPDDSPYYAPRPYGDNDGWEENALVVWIPPKGPDPEKPGALPASAYALIYPRLAEIARAHGYALGLHGSLGTDMDIIAAPWTDDAGSAEDLVEAIREHVDGFVGWDNNPGKEKPHGRRTWLIWFQGARGPLGGRCHIDISVMPRRAE